MNRLTFLGTGTSQGIPIIGCGCNVCRSDDPRDRRLRSSALIEYGGLSIVVDCGPDFRYQMLRSGTTHIDAILLTHNHLDHTGGLDDTRSFNLLESKPVNIYCEKYVEDSLRRQYAYAFADPKYPGSPEWHIHTIGKEPFSICSNENDEDLVWESGYGYHHCKPSTESSKSSITVIPIQGWHHKEKKLSVLGYRFGDIAYLTDMSMVEDCEFEKLKGLKAVTVNCVSKKPHYSHFSLEEAVAFLERVDAEESYITHISHRLPRQQEFEAELPERIHPAYDGLVLEF